MKRKKYKQMIINNQMEICKLRSKICQLEQKLNDIKHNSKCGKNGYTKLNIDKNTEKELFYSDNQQKEY